MGGRKRERQREKLGIKLEGEYKQEEIKDVFKEKGRNQEKGDKIEGGMENYKKGKNKT